MVLRRSDHLQRMSSPTPKFVPIPLAKAIDHYFHLALYLLVCTGFATLTSTGGLGVRPLILLCMSPARSEDPLALPPPICISKRRADPPTIFYLLIFYTAAVLLSP